MPDGTRVLICELDGVGRDHPLSMEKLSPILAYYVVDNLEQGSERCAQILRYGGMGHTASIHTGSREAAKEYGVRMPVSRVIVNSPSTHGAIGFTTDLEPSMTLGCGSWGGNVTSDNISPRHLIDVKRIAFETKPINQAAATDRAVARPAQPLTVDRAAIAALVDRFLAERRAPAHASTPTAPVSSPLPSPPEASSSEWGASRQAGLPESPAPQPTPPPAPPATASGNGAVKPSVYDFVCEQDVRRAIAAREKIHVNARTIITPAARDLGDEHEVFARG